MTYQIWAGTWGVPIGAEGEDDDSDGLLNLYEYALGGNPTNGFVESGVAPSVEVQPGSLILVHGQRNDDSSLVYYLETNADLLTDGWNNGGYTVLGTNLTEGAIDYVTNSIPTSDPQKFIRLIVE